MRVILVALAVASGLHVIESVAPPAVGPNVRICWDGGARFQDPSNYPDCPISREYVPVCGTDGLCYPNPTALKCTNKHLLETGQITEKLGLDRTGEACAPKS